MSVTSVCADTTRVELDPAGSGPVLLRVHGDLDVVTAPLLAACLDEALADRAGVVLDLREVSFLGCAALAVLDAVARRARRHGRRLTVAAGPD